MNECAMVPKIGMPNCLLGEHRGGAGEARDVARARCQQSGLAAMGAAQAEIDQQLAGRRQHHARGLGGHQRLEMQDS